MTYVLGTLQFNPAKSVRTLLDDFVTSTIKIKTILQIQTSLRTVPRYYEHMFQTFLSDYRCATHIYKNWRSKDAVSELMLVLVQCFPTKFYEVSALWQNRAAYDGEADFSLHLLGFIFGQSCYKLYTKHMFTIILVILLNRFNGWEQLVIVSMFVDVLCSYHLVVLGLVQDTYLRTCVPEKMTFEKLKVQQL